MRDDVSWADYICLYAKALDLEELAQYNWWVNSQQDPARFPWSSPDKAGTEPVLSLVQEVKNIAAMLPELTYEERYQRAIDTARALERPVVFMDADRNYWDEAGFQVVLFENGDLKRPTELGKKAIVIPVKYGNNP